MRVVLKTDRFIPRTTANASTGCGHVQFSGRSWWGKYRRASGNGTSPRLGLWYANILSRPGNQEIAST